MHCYKDDPRAEFVVFTRFIKQPACVRHADFQFDLASRICLHIIRGCRFDMFAILGAFSCSTLLPYFASLDCHWAAFRRNVKV